MIVYRITKKEYLSLDGRGGLFGSGRWRRKGNLVVYTSEHASLAAWEKIVHLANFENLPNELLLVKIEMPDDIEIQTVPNMILIEGWDSFPYIYETINYGTSFLRKNEHLALKVPSAIVPDEFNVLLNPLHPDIHRCKMISTVPFIFDKRIPK